jgi:hypothetical protein
MAVALYTTVPWTIVNINVIDGVVIVHYPGVAVITPTIAMMKTMIVNRIRVVSIVVIRTSIPEAMWPVPSPAYVVRGMPTAAVERVPMPG